MRNSFRKFAMAALVAAGASLAISAPAEAQHWHGGGGHYGGGHYGGGHYGGGHYGGWRGGGFGLGLFAPYPYYGYGYGYGGYDDGCYRYRPVYNRYGHYVGRRLVDVCY